MNLVSKLQEINKSYKLDKNLKLRIIDTEGKGFEGQFESCTQALDNEPEVASIELRIKGNIISFYENEINLIEVI